MAIFVGAGQALTVCQTGVLAVFLVAASGDGIRYQNSRSNVVLSRF